MTELTYFEATVPFGVARRVVTLPAGPRSARRYGDSHLVRVRARPPALWAIQRGAEAEQLRAYLALCLDQWSGEFPEDQLAKPTDAGVAQWIQEQMRVPRITHVAVQSSAYQGVERAVGGTAQIWRRFDLQCSHHLPHVPSNHRCARMHDHEFGVFLQAEASPADEAICSEYERLVESWKVILAGLNLQPLNAVPGLANPTMENVAAWVWARAKAIAPSLSWVTVWDAEHGACFDGIQYRAWMSMAFESKSILRYSSDGGWEPKMGSHSYILRIHSDALFDEEAGAVLGPAKCEEWASAARQCLGKQPTKEFPGLDGLAMDHFLGWLAFKVFSEKPNVCRLDLYEQPGYGAILNTGVPGAVYPV